MEKKLISLEQRKRQAQKEKEDYIRMMNDVKYDFIVPLFKVDHYFLTPKQVKENFAWFIAKMPERIEYLKNRCAQDLNISVKRLDLSPESLILIWKWYLQTAKIEKTPADQVEEMEKQWGFLGKESKFLQYEQLTVASHMILWDIGMYLGEVFTTNYRDIITWNYFINPKSDINARRPILVGFYHKNPQTGNLFAMPFDPIVVILPVSHKIIDNVQKESDLFDLYVRLKKDIHTE